LKTLLDFLHWTDVYLPTAFGALTHHQSVQHQGALECPSGSYDSHEALVLTFCPTLGNDTRRWTMGKRVIHELYLFLYSNTFAKANLISICFVKFQMSNLIRYKDLSFTICQNYVFHKKLLCFCFAFFHNRFSSMLY